MKKQFAKIKIAAENLSRSNKQERKDFELETIEKQVEKYRDVLEKIVRKLPTTSGTSSDPQERDKRIKKSLHYKIGQSLDESSKELSKEMPLQRVLANCGDLEKSLAECIVDCELETETEVVRRLKNILDNEIQEISTLKRNVSRTIQEHTSLKRSYEAAIKLDEPQTKINSIKDQQEQCEVKLEKERDQWAAQMFELIAKEDVIVQCIRDYVLNQRNYHERALRKVNSSLASIQDVIQTTVKSRFGTSLTDHLDSSNREISYIIELCVCCLLEHGIYEEGLLRVGCASTKLRRMKHALEAQYVKTPLPVDYQDPYVIGAILKLYLRELPEPLMTYKYYKEFMHALDRDSETERMQAIKMVLGKLPKANYVNLRYLTKFLWHITQNVDHNKMSSQNLAIVMSPNMLWPRVDKSNPAADYLGQMNSSSASNTIVELLISHWDYFFEGGDVEFFVTLQRNKLFMEGKSKSNSSSENLDKHGDGDMHDSPRYGTIRRQKANAPSPPTKAQTTTSNGDGGGGNSANGEVYAYRNGEISRPHAKELFPSGTYQQTNERPEKPPLPKQLQLQQQQQQQNQQQNQQQVQLHSVHQKQMQSQVNISNVLSQQQQQHNNQQSQDATTPKPVPMTRTQFFGLDNLPSPVADRKSTDSSIFKPDLPLKPKIPKRPMVLGLNSANKSDDEGGTTPTPTQPLANTMLGAANLPEDSAGDSANKSRTNSIGSASGFGSGSNSDDNNGNELLKKSTEQLIEQLRQESLCDKMNVVGGGQPQPQQTSATNLNAAKELNQHNQRLLESEQQQQATLKNTQPQLLQLQTQTQTQAQSQSQAQAQTQTHQRQPTPTTPISPNMFQAPKRPTVPAPPPPSIVKKQVE